jgi:beta-phosphoglucomutase-like phosphatase (HAD superfamily)
MEALFQGRVFSASTVARGKPHPGIFLHAAAEIGVQPERCIILEDNASGMIAGRAAGATVVGLLAAGHIRDGHGAVLADAGAHYVVDTFREAEEVVRNLVCDRHTLSAMA